jgi:hypothetical protein
MLHRRSRSILGEWLHLPSICRWWTSARQTEKVRVLFAQYRQRFARADLPGILLCFATNPVAERHVGDRACEVL